MTTEHGSTDDRMIKVRPYAMTRGRTRPKVDLSLETMVQTTDRGQSMIAEATAEDRRILEMAASPMSVAEISAHLGVVLGVAKVLVADHVAAGRLDCSSDPSSAASADVSLLERVLDGLQAL